MGLYSFPRGPRFPRLVVREGPPICSDLFIEPEPPPSGAVYYELCDLGGKMVACHTWMGGILKEMRRHPRRTVFLVRQYGDRGGLPELLHQFWAEIDLGGRARSWPYEEGTQR